MKKILNLLVILMMAIVLVACNKPSDDPFKLDEKKAVELSSAEIIDLISNLDQDQIFNDNFKMTFEGSFKQEIFRAFEDSTDHIVILGNGNGELSASLAEQVTDAVVLFKAEVEMEQTYESGGVKNSAGAYVYDESSSQKMEGSLEAFIVDTFAYYNLQADYKEFEDGELQDSEKINVKEMMNKGINQEMYETIKNPLSLLFGGMGGSEFEIPEVDLEDFDEVLDKLPKIKAYKDGNKYSLVIDINKQSILDNLEEAVYELAETMGFDRPDKAQVDEVIEEIDEAIQEFSFKYLIVIENNKVLNIMLEIKLTFTEVEDGFSYFLGDFRNTTTTTIDFKFEINKQSEPPVLPTDLDQYTPVDSPSVLS